MPRQLGGDLQGHRAGFVSRLIADVVDGIILLIIGSAMLLFVALILFLIRPWTFGIPNVPLWAVLTAGGLLILIYFGYGWSGPGRTVGKELTGLRVVDSGGHLLNVRRALLRAAFYLVFPAGLLLCVVSRHNASVQDLVLRTAVVYDWSRRRPETLMSSAATQPAGATQPRPAPTSVRPRTAPSRH